MNTIEYSGISNNSYRIISTINKYSNTISTINKYSNTISTITKYSNTISKNDNNMKNNRDLVEG